MTCPAPNHMICQALSRNTTGQIYIIHKNYVRPKPLTKETHEIYHKYLRVGLANLEAMPLLPGPSPFYLFSN